METAFKGMGYAVQVKELNEFYDHYGLEVPGWKSDDEAEDSDELEGSDDEDDEDDEDDSEED
jgi:hypothetical protein